MVSDFARFFKSGAHLANVGKWFLKQLARNIKTCIFNFTCLIMIGRESNIRQKQAGSGKYHIDEQLSNQLINK